MVGSWGRTWGALKCTKMHQNGPKWTKIVVHFGALHVWTHDPSMACTDSYPLSRVHFIQKKIILVTQDKFETLLLCHDIVNILVHFGQFGTYLCILVHLMYDPMTPPWLILTWLLSPFKSPFNPEKDHISHSGQIRNTFAPSWYGYHFGPFWFILVHLMGDPTTPLHQIFKKSSKICILRIKSFYMWPVLPS